MKLQNWWPKVCKLSLQVASVPEKEEGRAATVASQLEGLGKQQAREFDFHPSYNSRGKRPRTHREV